MRAERRRASLVIGVVAAVAYSSWPLGYLVNRTVASQTLASTLEARNQPNSWLFVLLDCTTGALCAVAVALDWSDDPPRGAVRLRQISFCGFALFGVITAVNALIPFGCGNTPVTACATSLSNLSLDDVLTGSSVFVLFLGGCAALARTIRLRRAIASVCVGAAVVGFGACGLVFFHAHFSARAPVGLQHVFLSFTSVLAAVIIAATVTVEGREVRPRRNGPPDADPGAPRNPAAHSGRAPAPSSP